MESLAKFIIENYERDEGSTTLGNNLFDAVVGSINEKEENEELSEIDIKVIRYGEIEREGNLAYFDYDSWGSIPWEVRARISQALDPLFWGGAFFEYSKFIELEDMFFRNVHETLDICLIHEFKKRYRFLSIKHFIGDSHDYLSDRQLKYEREKIEKHIIRGYGLNSKGETIIKDYESNKQKVLKRGEFEYDFTAFRNV